MSELFRTILPEEGFNTHEMVIRQVDLPAPLLPIRETISFLPISRSMPLRASMGP